MADKPATSPSSGEQYVIWHDPPLCPHQNQHVCDTCDHDEFYALHYPKPEGTLPKRAVKEE